MAKDKDTQKTKSETRNTGRHSNGRWKKGHCPNQHGRGYKEMMKGLEIEKSVNAHTSDLFLFGREVVSMNIGGKTEYMTREASIIYKRYECAMKGSVTAQRDLLKDIRESVKMLASLKARFDEMLLYWYGEHPNIGDPDFEIPLHVQLEFTKMQSVLGSLHPDLYPPRTFMDVNGKEVDEDENQ